MAISITKYIDITSGVGAPTIVPNRDLIGRLFTTNPLLPTNSVLEFTDQESVSAYFGNSSQEYLRALFYFSFISKNITSPQKISFARWANANEPPTIFGTKITASVSDFMGITDGAIRLTLGTTTNVISGLDFSAVTSLADVASVLQTGIRAETGLQWTAATVTFDVQRGAFDFVGGDPGVPAVIVVGLAATGTEIIETIGWYTGAILSNGIAGQTITEVLDASSGISNNFGSYLFMPVLTLDQITESATWNLGQDFLFQYTVPVYLEDVVTYNDALIDIGGTILTLQDENNIFTEYPEMCPMLILAATDYSSPNAVQNYMYQFVNSTLTSLVTDTTTSNMLDQLRINYIGQTQTAGNQISFYQRGVMMGGANYPVFINSYANEQWLKDAIAADILNLQLSIGQIPANNQGKAQILSIIQSDIDQALLNGSISVGKPLTTQQKLYIKQISGIDNDEAWQQIQTDGYWVDINITSVPGPSGVAEFIANYVLIYSKDDVINKITGQDILI